MENDSTKNMWKIRMETLTKRKRIIEIAETIDKVLYEWYSERGLDVPHWKPKKNVDWCDRKLDEEKE